MVDTPRNINRKIGLRMWLSGGWLLFLLLATLFAPIISPHDPLAQDLFASRLPPFWMNGYEAVLMIRWRKIYLPQDCHPFGWMAMKQHTIWGLIA